MPNQNLEKKKIIDPDKSKKILEMIEKAEILRFENLLRTKTTKRLQSGVTNNQGSTTFAVGQSAFCLPSEISDIGQSSSHVSSFDPSVVQENNKISLDLLDPSAYIASVTAQAARLTARCFKKRKMQYVRLPYSKPMLSAKSQNNGIVKNEPQQSLNGEYCSKPGPNPSTHSSVLIQSKDSHLLQTDFSIASSSDSIENKYNSTAKSQETIQDVSKPNTKNEKNTGNDHVSRDTFGSSENRFSATCISPYHQHVSSLKYPLKLKQVQSKFNLSDGVNFRTSALKKNGKIVPSTASFCHTNVATIQDRANSLEIPLPSVDTIVKAETSSPTISKTNQNVHLLVDSDVKIATSTNYKVCSSEQVPLNNFNRLTGNEHIIHPISDSSPQNLSVSRHCVSQHKFNTETSKCNSLTRSFEHHLSNICNKVSLNQASVNCISSPISQEHKELLNLSQPTYTSSSVSSVSNAPNGVAVNFDSKCTSMHSHIDGYSITTTNVSSMKLKVTARLGDGFSSSVATSTQATSLFHSKSIGFYASADSNVAKTSSNCGYSSTYTTCNITNPLEEQLTETTNSKYLTHRLNAAIQPVISSSFVSPSKLTKVPMTGVLSKRPCHVVGVSALSSIKACSSARSAKKSKKHKIQNNNKDPLKKKQKLSCDEKHSAKKKTNKDAANTTESNASLISSQESMLTFEERTVKQTFNYFCQKPSSNSKIFVLEQFSKPCTPVSCDRKKSKKRSRAKESNDHNSMPAGENGLPVSVLSCSKRLAKLKRSGKSFMQDAACHEISAMNGISIMSIPNGASMLPKCRECRHVKRKGNSTVFCRFYGFRRLAFVNGHLQTAGFCDPEDSRASDISVWLPKFHPANSNENKNHSIIELDTCHYIVSHIGGKFCELVEEEREAITSAKQNGDISWKRPVPGVREMCDACETTLFNFHWVCQRCGFGVCSACYKIRQKMSEEEQEVYDSDKSNPCRWLRCTKGIHLPSYLSPTQIIPSTCLFDLCELVHQVIARWNFISPCRCKKNTTAISASLSTSMRNKAKKMQPNIASKPHTFTLDESAPKCSSSKSTSSVTKPGDPKNLSSALDWLMNKCYEKPRSEPDHESLKATNQAKTPAPLAGENSAPRSWLCNSQLLQLTDSKNKVNVDTFQHHWFFGMPVMASGATKNLNRNLWKPETFSAEHGDQPTGNALVNCRKGSIITNAFIKDFWIGFESIKNRLRDEKSGEKMILKLKDWPTTHDFIDTMPEKFDDLMKALPLPQYTGREGKFNIASYLPDFFVRPDLGPKMYIAYGWVTEKDWTQGTTNLHLDISDACNLMVYVGIPEDEPRGALDALIKIIKEGDADPMQVERAKTEKPGALWHIFKPSDTDKIREMILKVKAENGIVVSDDHDPIHDQQIYLDKSLRRRLKKEYGVEGYPLVQCEGDSVFIPAGAPHQVFNLHSCIKVAEDFVSPEHVDKCFKLMEEFRHLSTTHSNHEDKLQLKNIIYHTMKEVVSSLSWYEAKKSNIIAPTLFKSPA